MSTKPEPKKGADLVILGTEPGNEKITATPAPALIESQIKTEVAKIDISRQAIVALKKKYGSLTISGPDDKKGYEAVDDARKDVKKKAAAVDNKRKEINARFLAVTRGVNAYAGQLEEPLRELQRELEDKLKVIDDQKAEEERQKAEAEKQALDARINELEAAGIKFNGQWYSIGENIALDILTIKGFDDEQFNILLQNVKTEKQRLDQVAENERLERDRLEREQKEERDRLENQRIDQENRQKDLQRQQEELNNMLAEAKRGQIVNRQATMITHGFTYELENQRFIYKHYDCGHAIMLDSEIEALSSDDWTHRLNKVLSQKELISEANQKEADRIETQTNRNNTRIAELKALGFAEITGGLNISSELLDRSFDVVMHNIEGDTLKQWEKRIVDIKKMLAAWDNEVTALKIVNDKKREQTRKEALSDWEKIKEYLTAIRQVRTEKPTLINSVMAEELNHFETELSAAVYDLEAAAESWTNQ